MHLGKRKVRHTDEWEPQWGESTRTRQEITNSVLIDPTGHGSEADLSQEEVDRNESAEMTEMG